MKKYNKDFRPFSESGKGFAIIELIVVIAIVGALTAVAISNFPKIKLQLSLSRAAHAFSQDLRKAQQMALSGLIYKDSSGTEQEVDGYGVYVDLDGQGDKKYIIYADKSPGNKEYDGSDYLVEFIDLSVREPGIKIKEIHNVSSDKASINFNSFRIETVIAQLSEGQNSVEIVFTIEVSGQTKTVSVNTSGLIEVK